jgi:hypothetical protein
MNFFLKGCGLIRFRVVVLLLIKTVVATYQRVVTRAHDYQDFSGSEPFDDELRTPFKRIQIKERNSLQIVGTPIWL